MQTDGRGAECVCLNDVGACFEILRMNLVDDFGLGQKQQLEAALEVLAFPIAKPFSPIIRLGQLVALDHCAHGAVEQNDSFAQHCFQRMKF